MCSWPLLSAERLQNILKLDLYTSFDQQLFSREILN